MLYSIITLDIMAYVAIVASNRLRNATSNRQNQMLLPTHGQ